MSNQFLISKELARSILMIGVSKSTYGGMAAVLVSYEKYFEVNRFIPTWKLGNKFLKTVYAFQAIIRCLLLLSFDSSVKILHIHGAANASFYRKRIFIRLGKFFDRKVILHQHAADFKEFYEQSTNKNEIVNTMNQCDKLIVLSESWRTYFTSIGVDVAKIHILNNIVTPPVVLPKKRIDNKLHLLFLGEISNRKGIYDLLNVLKDHKALFENGLSLRIGGNAVDGNINDFITINELAQFVKYEGWVSGNKKVECLEWADVYVLPSYNEGLPIAILEAMSYRRPVISTKVGGIPEIIHTHRNGILMEAGNLNELKEALVFFIENPDKIVEYGKNSYETVIPFFPESVFKELTTIYEKLLQNENDDK